MTTHRRAPSRSRRESKELTRQALLRGALRLLSRNSFDSISLREVSREAGITPTAFYRHFDDMEELGLVLVEESFEPLRQMLRSARTDPVVGSSIHQSVLAVAAHSREYEGHIRFIVRERFGGIRRLRRAIRRELELLADELAIDLQRAHVLDGWSLDDGRMFAGLVIEVMVAVAADLVETKADEDEQDVIEQAERKLRLLFVGVTNWRSDVAPGQLAGGISDN